MDVPIPELGAESIVEGGILSLNKGVGDYVNAEEMVAEIETGTFHTKIPPYVPFFSSRPNPQAACICALVDRCGV